MALTAILDTCALVIAGTEDGPKRQAQLTFAMARHAVVDLAGIFLRSREMPPADRLPTASWKSLCQLMSEIGVGIQEDEAAEQKVRELRQMYEPYVQGLSAYLSMNLPPWFPVTAMPDSWQTTEIVTETATGPERFSRLRRIALSLRRTSATHSSRHPDGHA